MTLEEADKVAQIFGIADGGCGHCAHAMADKFMEQFPEFKIVGDVSRDEYDVWGLRALPATPT